jgi:hypothetical protein
VKCPERQVATLHKLSKQTRARDVILTINTRVLTSKNNLLQHLKTMQNCLKLSEFGNSNCDKIDTLKTTEEMVGPDLGVETEQYASKCIAHDY